MGPVNHRFRFVFVFFLRRHIHLLNELSSISLATALHFNRSGLFTPTTDLAPSKNVSPAIYKAYTIIKMYLHLYTKKASTTIYFLLSVQVLDLYAFLQGFYHNFVHFLHALPSPCGRGQPTPSNLKSAHSFIKCRLIFENTFISNISFTF
jgi:hypothetical protein